MEKETALKILRERHAKALFSERTALETLIPELKESEDERIRKEIISIVKSYRDSCITEGNHRFDNCIAWLEKQGEKQKTKIDLIMWKPVSEYTGGRVLTTNGVDILVGYINSDGDCESEDCEGTLLCGIIGFVKIENILPKLKQGEQNPTDKAEPKFKIGDWVVYDTEEWWEVLMVDRVNDGIYHLVDVNGETSNALFEEECNMRLWSIGDAKVGDVLTWDNSTCIALFKKIDNEYSFNSYGYVGHCTGMFETGHSCHDIKGSHPATKEQRDLLFQKMKEAGYEWDTEKRELKKVNV